MKKILFILIAFMLCSVTAQAKKKVSMKRVASITISVTIGETEMYTGIVYSKKQENPDKNTKMIVYLAIQEFQGHKVPLQIFEIYDLSKSLYIPDSFSVMICSEKTGEMIQGQSFHNVSRIR